MSSDQLIRIAEFFNTIDIGLVKGVLENNQIFSIIEGEHFADLQITVGGVSNQLFLKVFKRDIAKAIAIIETMDIEKCLLIRNV